MSIPDRVNKKEDEPIVIKGSSAMERVSNARPSWDFHVDLRNKVHQKLVQDLTAGIFQPESLESETKLVRDKTEQYLTEAVEERNMIMTREEKLKLIDILVNDMLGFGPLEELLADGDITEIMVNGPGQIFVERKGQLFESPVVFDSEAQLNLVIDRIVQPIGRRIDEAHPMCDARLKDGSRVNIIIPPLALSGPTITIRKFPKNPLTFEDLLEMGSITKEMLAFLKACVEAKLNIIVSGGTGSGKTTFLNILSGFIPKDERIVTIEDAAELQLHQEHVLALEARPANVEGQGQVGIRELVINALRMRPDRIVVGECRGGEALDMLQAMNTGHDGSLTTIHANSPVDMLNRLETLVLMAGVELPSRAIREQIASAIQIIVQQAKVRGGSRKIVSITELFGYNSENKESEFALNELFRYHQSGIDENGNAVGIMKSTGNPPHFLEKIQSEGIAIDPSQF